MRAQREQPRFRMRNLTKEVALGFLLIGCGLALILIGRNMEQNSKGSGKVWMWIGGGLIAGGALSFAF